MTDIVERLRAALATNLSLRSMAHHERDHKGNIEIADMLDAAADEIERLLHEEMRLRTALDYHVNELRAARREIDRLRGAA